MGDTHVHLPNIRRVVGRMNAEQVDLVLHTGDYIAPFVIPVLAGLEAGMVGVFGNNDGDRELLTVRCAEHPSLEIRGTFTEIDRDGRHIALLHGHDKGLLAATVQGGEYDLVVHGHTHRGQVEKKERTLVVNPGEVCGYLTGTPTCALYDTETGAAVLVNL